MCFPTLFSHDQLFNYTFVWVVALKFQMHSWRTPQIGTVLLPPTWWCNNISTSFKVMPPTCGDAAVWCYLDLRDKAQKTLLFGLHTENSLFSLPHSSLQVACSSLRFCASTWDHFPFLEEMCFRISCGASSRGCVTSGLLVCFSWKFSFLLHIWRTLGEKQSSCWIVFFFQQFIYVIAPSCGFHGFWWKSQQSYSCCMESYVHLFF